MGAVGIIANPQSGKDARRLVADATMVGNHDKVGIVRRIFRALGHFGVERVLMMPDEFGIGSRALDRVPAPLELLDLPIRGTEFDTTQAARMMAPEIACLITIGGDGTNRAVALGTTEVPLIPVSTGTNNVFPSSLDGTIVGLVAAGLARGVVDPAEVSQRTKMVRVDLDGERVDLALVDAAITTEPFIGTRAIWDGDVVRHLVLTRAQPHNLGLSAIGGILAPVGEAEPAGLSVELGPPGRPILAPIAPGLLKLVRVRACGKVPIGYRHEETADRSGTLTLDGERSRAFAPGQRIRLELSDRGPLVVSVPRAMGLLAQRGFFFPDGRGG